MNQIEKALSDYLGEMCGMRLKPHALTGLAKAAIAAMPVQTEPVAWMYEVNGVRNCYAYQLPYWSPAKETETPLYAHPPAQWTPLPTPPAAGGSDAE